MKLVIFAVADEGHFVTDGTEYGKVIRFADSDKLATLNELTDEEYYEMFPNERPVEEEVAEGEILEGEIEPEVIEPTDENTTENEETVNENI